MANYPKELTDLLQQYMTDGVMTDKERTVLLRKAKSLGVDKDEFDLYIDAEEQKFDQKIGTAKRQAYGRVCPACGKQVPQLALQCDCGYEFTNTKAVSSVKGLSDKLTNLEQGFRESLNEFTARKIEIISTWPVPNTKEEIIDFLSICVSGATHKIGFFEKRSNWLNIMILCLCIPFVGWFAIFYVLMGFANKDFYEIKLKEAWKSKLKQVIMKGRALHGTAEFTRQLDYFEKMAKENKIISTCFTILLILLCIGINYWAFFIEEIHMG